MQDGAQRVFVVAHVVRESVRLRRLEKEGGPASSSYTTTAAVNYTVTFAMNGTGLDALFGEDGAPGGALALCSSSKWSASHETPRAGEKGTQACGPMSDA